MKIIKKNIFSLFSALSVALLIVSCSKRETNYPFEPDMIFVEGGSCMMGCEGTDGYQCYDMELPLHRVYVDDFLIGKYELTVAEFKAFIDSTGYQTSADRKGCSYCFNVESLSLECIEGVNWSYNYDGEKYPITVMSSYPVVHITYTDIIEYCKWLSDLTGKHYRMPTEAEWEYASRGGIKDKSSIFSGSNDLKEVGWSKLDKVRDNATIGKRKPNELGLYDMSGNVWEYCSDYREYYIVEDSINPKGSPKGEFRVLRGGCVISDPNRCTVWSRASSFPDYSRDRQGFRIACDVEKSK